MTTQNTRSCCFFLELQAWTLKTIPLHLEWKQWCLFWSVLKCQEKERGGGVESDASPSFASCRRAAVGMWFCPMCGPSNFRPTWGDPPVFPPWKIIKLTLEGFLTSHHTKYLNMHTMAEQEIWLMNQISRNKSILALLVKTVKHACGNYSGKQTPKKRKCFEKS